MTLPRPFAEYPPQLQAAVDAYDHARREISGFREPPMSDANKAHIAPMIMSAVFAYVMKTVGGAS